MTYEYLMDEIESRARFEALVQLPEKRDPDWPKWSARATREEHSFTGTGDDDLAALVDLLDKLSK